MKAEQIRDRVRLAILISGRGSNMEAILQATKTPEYPAEPTLVISDKADAKGLETARKAGISAIALDRSGFADRQAHEEKITQTLKENDIELIALAGFMRILSPDFVSRFEKRILNIHPSLLPAYKGLETHARALSDGVREHGCSVHFVDHTLDGGEVIGQAHIQVHECDTAQSLAARVLEQEHLLYPQMVAKIAQELRDKRQNAL